MTHPLSSCNPKESFLVQGWMVNFFGLEKLLVKEVSQIPLVDHIYLTLRKLRQFIGKLVLLETNNNHTRYNDKLILCGVLCKWFKCPENISQGHFF